jgi:hypothetical protein
LLRFVFFSTQDLALLVLVSFSPSVSLSHAV